MPGWWSFPARNRRSAISLNFRENGWDRDLAAHRRRGGHVVGICGGYQMLGRTVRDPDGIEGSVTESRGPRPARRRDGDGAGKDGAQCQRALGAVRRCRSTATRSISAAPPARTALRPSAVINGVDDGAISADGKVFGTYLHGLFSADAFRARFLESLGVKGGGIDYRAEVERALDEIAAELETHLDCDAIFGLAR